MSKIKKQKLPYSKPTLKNINKKDVPQEVLEDFERQIKKRKNRNS